MSIDLYYIPSCPGSRAVLYLANQLNIKLNLKVLDLKKRENLTPEFLKINPQHTVSTIVDDGFALWESRTILRYLCNKYAPDSELYPKSLKKRAVVDRMLDFSIEFHMIIKEVFFLNSIRGTEPTEEQLKSVALQLELIENFIGDNKYLTGDCITIADMSLFATSEVISFNKFDNSSFLRFKECTQMGLDMYSDILCPSCRSVLYLLKELNIKFNLKPIDLANREQMTPEFLKINPLHKIPTIVDDGFILWESRAVMQYLCNKYAPDSELYPKAPKKRAVVDRMLNFDTGSYYSTMNDTFIPKFMRGTEPTDEQLKSVKEKLELMEKFIGDNKFVTGDSMTIVDMTLLSSSTILLFVGYDVSAYPRFNQWYQRMENEYPYISEMNKNGHESFKEYREKKKSEENK